MQILHLVGDTVDNALLFDNATTFVGGVITTPDGIFPAAPSGESYMQQEGAGVGWKLVSGALVRPPARALPVLSKDQLSAYANAFQWRHATGGHNVTIGGSPHLFATDNVSLSLMTGKAVRFMQPGAPTSVNWQIASGFVTISAADFAAAADNIADWVQSTFDALGVVLAAITAGTITTAAEVDAATWPTS